MKIKINNNYIFFCMVVFLLLIDSILLIPIKDNTTLFLSYITANILCITAICMKVKSEWCVFISILMILFYTFFIDAYIHYFKLNIILEAEFLFLIPLIVSVIRTHNKNTKIFSIVTITYIMFNLIVTVVGKKVSIYNYSTFMVNIISFLGFYYVVKNTEIKKGYTDLMKFVFYVSFVLTILQTVMKFNTDTRNGVFSVFGFGAYTFFIMMYFLYYFNEFINKKISIYKFLITIVLCSLIYICTESKAAIIILVMNIAIISVIKKGISLKKIIVVFLAISMIPLAYGLLLKFNPKFAYLNNVDSIINYYTGNNNWKYKYGRFEAIKNVYSEQDTNTKIIGTGMGSSTPMYMVFNTELGRSMRFPYYINRYGYYYGYQHTSASTILLDGGLILFIMLISFICTNLIKSMVDTSKDVSNKKAFMKFGVLIYFVYYFTYANVLKDFRAMAIIGIILGLDIYVRKNENKGVMKVNDKDNNSL